MKIFSVYARVILTQKPEWFDEFRKRYDKPWEIHVSLKQPCFLPEEKLSELRETIRHFFEEHRQKSTSIRFDEAVCEKEDDGMSIMIGSRNAGELRLFQKRLSVALAGYGEYMKPEYRGYEESFWPHITIARNLSDESTREASKFLERGYECVGEIKEIVLAVVSEMTPDEAKKAENQTVFHLAEV